MNMDALYKIFLANPSVETDTRKIKPGDIFFALKGPNFNGNKYAKQALDAGASYCVCDEKGDTDDERILLTDDVLTALQQLAKKHREQFNIPVIAITGSNGKTTTKELIHKVLSAKYRCYTTKGNLNNHIGVPLTLLSIKLDAEIAIIEMGANHLHEIESYCKYALPTHGLITNTGKAHLEGFGSLEGVRKGKGELYDFLAANNGTAFMNTDYDYLKEMGRLLTHIITYGTHDADYTGTAAGAGDYLKVNITKGAATGTINTQLAGDYNLPNVLSAVCIGKAFDVPDEQIRTALESYAPDNSRSQIIKKGTNTILLDAYNANPSSMKVAIENFASLAGDYKVVILGGMMELGPDSIAEHTAVLDLLKKYKWSKAAVAGKDYVNVDKDMFHFANAAETAEWFRTQQFENAFILIKGSRGMAMEKILE